jgi:hypothetical protein
MTCKAGRELLRKLVLPCLTAMALMLCAALPARAQATHSTVNLMVMTSDGNTYSCELALVSTPSGRANGHCIATLTNGEAVMEATRFDDQMAMELMVMNMGGMTMIMEMPFGMVDVEEIPGGTANVTYHD